VLADAALCVVARVTVERAAAHAKKRASRFMR
jgi:hypothetical protein